MLQAQLHFLLDQHYQHFPDKKPMQNQPLRYKEQKVCPINWGLMDVHVLAKHLKFTSVQAASIAFGRDITAKEIKDFILM